MSYAGTEQAGLTSGRNVGASARRWEPPGLFLLAMRGRLAGLSRPLESTSAILLLTEWQQTIYWWGAVSP